MGVNKWRKRAFGQSSMSICSEGKPRANPTLMHGNVYMWLQAPSLMKCQIRSRDSKVISRTHAPKTLILYAVCVCVCVCERERETIGETRLRKYMEQ
jgi:hypothetical protein